MPAETLQYRKFTAPLDTEYDKAASDSLGYDVWRVLPGFQCYSGQPADDTWVFVPANYLSDGATVPRVLWGLIPPWGAYGQAAVLHDWLCNYGTIFIKGVDTKITRTQADKLFKEAMEVLEVPRWKKNLMYIAVRVYAFVARPRVPDGEVNKRYMSGIRVAPGPETVTS